MKVSQLGRNRRLWRTVDHDIARYGLVGGLSQLAVLLTFLVAGLLEVAPRLSLMLTLVQGLLVVTQAVVYFSFEQWYSPGPLRWRTSYQALHYTQSVAWTLVNALVLSEFAWAPMGVLSMLFTLALTFINMPLWAPHKQAHPINMTLMLVPPIIIFAFMQTPVSALTSALLVLVLYVGIKQSLRHHQRFWSQVQSNESAQQALRWLQIKQKHADTGPTLQTDFLANLSREIRLPMNNLLGMLTLLSDTQMTSDQRRMHNIATSAGENVINLIEEILDFSQIMSGRLILENSVFNIRRCIDECVNVLSPLAYAKRIELVPIYATDIPLRVQGDMKRITQGLTNLLTYVINQSSESTSSDSECILRVYLEPVSAAQAQIKLELSCERFALSSEANNRLKTFFENPQDTNTSAHVSLGLCILKGVAESMGGRVRLLESEDRSHWFEFCVNIVLSTQQTFRSSIPKSFVKKKVLLVNPTPGLSEALRAELESWLMDVQDIHDTQKALQVLRNSAREQYPFDLVVVNIGEVYQGSFKFSQILAADPSLGCIKQLFLVSLHKLGESQAINHQKQVEQCLFLTKPFTRGNLFHALSLLLDGQVPKSDLLLDGIGADKTDAEIKPFRILLVEDDKVSQMVVRGILKRFGYQIRAVANAEEALTLLDEQSFDLIMMDCYLPGMDGFELTQLIRDREQDTLNHVKIIAITASTIEGIEAKCYSVGMDAYLCKPVDPEKLEATLRVFLESAPDTEGVIYTQARSQ